MRGFLTFVPLAASVLLTLDACGGPPQGFSNSGSSASDGGQDTSVDPQSDSSSGQFESGSEVDATSGSDTSVAMPPPDASGGGGGPDAGPTGQKDAGSPPVMDAAAIDTGLPATSQKRGLAYGGNSDADLKVLSKAISWYYNWSPSPESSVTSGYYNQVGVEFVPMIWNGGFSVSQVESQIPAGSKYLLAFNEPNFGNQANLTPQQAAGLWPKVEQIAAAKGLKIVAPAVNYCGGNCNQVNPYTWLSQFFAACQGCQIDYIAVHTYVCTAPALRSYLSTYESMFNKPIWLTEFSCLDGGLPATTANESSYMQQAVQELEADPMIFRYAWFTGRAGGGSSAVSLLGSSGVLTSLGSEYVGLLPPK